MKIAFRVNGVPRPGGSKTAFPFRRRTGKLGVRVVDASGAQGRAWRKTVASAGAAAMVLNNRKPLSGPTHLFVSFTMPRPKTHYKADGTLRADAPRWHTAKPDATKLLRSLEDALTGICWTDDACVAVTVVKKEFGDTPGATVEIEPLYEDNP